MSQGQKLYIAWRNSCAADLDDWKQLPPEVQRDWETFAANLAIDHGLRID